ncbi:MAG: hypothetical protein RMJ48_21525 [Roseiflexaceae bacterium]|nr:hypothetical protein [Roseiflexaceae bacterium]
MKRSSRHCRAVHLPFLTLLTAAAIFRVALWGSLPRQGLISDEGEYLSAAWWLAYGRGFDWHQGYLWTRAPLYPLFLAAHVYVFGDHPAALVATQTLLSLINLALIYALARQIAPPALQATPLIATALAGIYFPFVIYPQLILSETLYICLVLGGVLALAHSARLAEHTPPNESRRADNAYRWHIRQSLVGIIVAGVLFGLATLTRSQTLLALPVIAGWAAFAGRRSLWRALVFLAVAALVVTPWTVYNSRIYGGLIPVDTSGAFNLLIGAWSAHNGERRDAPIRDFVLALFPDQRVAPPADTCLPHPGPQPHQAARQMAMIREGLCLIADRPLAFIRKSLIELVDLFRINYTGAERLTDGFSTGRLPVWYLLMTFLLDDTLYVLTLPLAVLGWAVIRRFPPGSGMSAVLVGIWLVFNILLAPLLFAINRFRIPLLPFLFILAAAAINALFRRRDLLVDTLRTGYGLACGVLAGALTLIAASPYAYLEPRPPGSNSQWASYLGPYPSSLAITGMAIAARPFAQDDARFLAALRAGDFAAAESILRHGTPGRDTARLGAALIAAHQGRYREALALLPPSDTLVAMGDVPGSVLRGDLLRSIGDEAGARAAFTPQYVDAANPIVWAWDWLRPAPTRIIDLGGNLDLGYIRGCYLGEGDAAERRTYRWCTDGALLRFPGAGRAYPQRLVFTVDGRGWPVDLRPASPVRVLLAGNEIGAFPANPNGVRTFEVTLPPLPESADVVIELRGPTFVPDAARYLSQQGAEAVGQVHRLMVRLDRVEIGK